MIKKILIAEDEDINYFLLEMILNRLLPNYGVLRALNGEEAVRLVTKDNDIEVVLMDLNMPIMDGFDATKNIRKHKNDKVNKLPIIALTASVIRADIQRCFDAGMNGYIPKPFKTSELIEAIYLALNEGGIQESISQYIEKEPSKKKASNKITNLSYLHDFTEGNEEMIKKYI